MEQIQHKHVQVGNLKLHVAEIGTGEKVVLFLHGFPEIWYSWRHQMVAVAKAGYTAIAIDYRGYGLSDQPPEPEKTTLTDFAEDVIGLLNSLDIDKEPGRAEADFGRFDVRTVIKNVYILFSGSELPIASDDQEIMDLVAPNTPIPPWLSEQDLSTYASLYEKSGFRTALQVPYRSMNQTIDVQDPLVEAPALFIMGEKDYVIKFPGMEETIRSGAIKKMVPNLETVFMPEGNHFVQEQLPEEVNQLIISFLNKHTVQ